MAQQERSTRTRRKIVEAGGAVFAQRGFEGAVISDVYAKVGVTRGAFYYHFSSKEDLAEAVLETQRGGEQYPLIPREIKLQEFVDAGMVFTVRLRKDRLLQGSVRLAVEKASHSLDRSKAFEAWVTHNMRGLTEARERGELHPHVQLDDVAVMIAGAYTGIQLMSEVMDDRRDVERRVSVFLQHVMPTIALPGILARLDMAADRGERVMAELEELGELGEQGANGTSLAP
ncbi:ScbR family autoregulator-binding transcription factor [Streptomyces monticola]|uniref:ScbR family autoregulator-binding transcription factor n=1 Tax=Streptomyces monticola TaxID=2666263 RepID=A0ABW2JXH0_9ACTN